LLEAMYYLCALESPRVRADLPLVRAGAEAAVLRGEAETGLGRVLVEVEVRGAGQNRVQVNRSPVRRKRDLRKQVRAVFAGPDDLAIVGGDPAERRRFLDEALRGLWPLKEGAGAAYDRALRQRNRLLKDWDGSGEPPGLSAWDEELVTAGTQLTLLREGAIEAVGPRAGAEFAALSGDPLIVEYESSVDRRELPESFHRRLAERRPDELVRRTTLVGPHRDDLRLVVQDLVARGFASHGESWAAALCLRLGLAAAVAEEAGEEPIRFLDDPFSGLDPERRDRIARRLVGPEQRVIAVPDDQHVPPGAAVWRVKEGRVVAE
ncbi:MAG TPA: DNA replication and repair protein RecF, partial [Actinomycetota bacterium]|nr:DNA replication and repair protein RecF [Actinomycetota bacterium]